MISGSMRYPLRIKCGAVLSGSCSRSLHRRIAVRPAERMQPERRAGDIEIEREMLVHRNHVAQVTLQRIALVDALRAIARPQRLDRLARLVDRERRLGAPVQL